MREELRACMANLANSPLLEARVCQYEDTPDKNMLIDRNPEAANVWFVSGGSGLGEYVAPLILGRRQPKARFPLSRSSVTKRGTVQRVSRPRSRAR
jgi:glycine/D-amino acid oxidase-like deaminating enzyme